MTHADGHLQDFSEPGEVVLVGLNDLYGNGQQAKEENHRLLQHRCMSPFGERIPPEDGLRLPSPLRRRLRPAETRSQTRGNIISSVSKPPSRRRRWILVTAAAAVTVTAGTGVYLGTRSSGAGSSADVEFVLGGGTGRTGAGEDIKVPGALQAMAVDDHGKVAAFVTDARGFVLWTVSKDGKATSVRVPELPTGVAYALTGQVWHEGAQATVAPDGTYYLALDAGGLWHITSSGQAEQVIKATASGYVTPDGPVGEFSTGGVEGVAVGNDGAIYFSDVQSIPTSVFVHRLSAGKVTTVAGKAVRRLADATSPTPGFARSLDPKVGAAAKGTYIPYHANEGTLAWHNGTLYFHSGDGIVKVTKAGRIFPVIAGRDTASLSKPQKPFVPFGSAINGYVNTPYRGDRRHAEGIAVDPTSGDLYYAAGAPLPSLAKADIREALKAGLDWHGDFTKSQASYLSTSMTNQVVYRTNTKNQLSAVVGNSDTIAVSNGYLYLANDTCRSDGAYCEPSKTYSSVVRLRLAQG